jgi:hypothetical protein
MSVKWTPLLLILIVFSGCGQQNGFRAGRISDFLLVPGPEGISIKTSNPAGMDQGKGLVGKVMELSGQILQEKNSPGVSASSWFVSVLIFLSLAFVASWGVIIPYVLLMKFYRVERENKRGIIGRRYLRIISTYLSAQRDSESPSFPGLSSVFHKKILISQLYGLSVSLIGKQQERLNTLYDLRPVKRMMDRGLRSFCRCGKSRYLKYFAVRRMCYEQLLRVRKHLNSRNPQLRLSTQLAVLNYEPRLLNDILAGYKYPLTTWDQMHIFELMLRRPTHPVDYYQLIDHENPTVVLFALRMIRFFYLKDEREQKIIPLMSHSSEQIRYEALKTASELKLEKVDKLLLAYISEINEKHKELIIEFLIRNRLVSTGELMDFFHQEKDPVAKLHILESILNKHPAGEELILKLQHMTSDPDVRSMCLHVREKSL